MRKVIYILIILLLFFVPLERVQIEKLLPVKAVAVYKTNDEYTIELDSGLKGSGASVSAAIENLEMNSTSIIYLKTAVYLFVDNDVVDISLLQERLKCGIKIYRIDAAGCVREMSDYVDAHGWVTNLHERKTR